VLLIFSCATDVEEKIDFSAGQHGVAERLRQIRTDAKKYSAKFGRGRTALYDALLEGVQLFGPSTSAADVLYLIGDGADNSSHTDFRKLTRELTSRGVRLFMTGVLGPLGYRNRTPEENNGPSDMSELVAKTGGDMVVPFPNGVPMKPDWNAVGQVMDVFYLRMVQNYRLELELPLPLNKPRNWELKLAPARKDQWKNVVLKYPVQLLSCGDIP
jgi:hypothetical protein